MGAMDGIDLSRDGVSEQGTHTLRQSETCPDALIAHCLVQFDEAMRGLKPCQRATIEVALAGNLAEQAAYARAGCWSADQVADLIVLAAKLGRMGS